MTIQYVDPFGFQWVRLLFLWKGGIFQVMWPELLIAISIITISLGIAYAVTQNYPDDWIFPSYIRSLAGTLAFVSSRFQAAIGLMLGFYTTTCYGRRSKVLQKEGDIQTIINKTSLLILCKTKESMQRTDDKFTTEEISNIRSELVRLVNLSHALAVGQVYEGSTSQGENRSLTLDSLLASGLLTEKEHDWFVDKRDSENIQEYVAPLAWFQDNINNLVEKEAFRFNADTAMEFEACILGLQESFDVLSFSVSEPVPLIYTQLVQVTVRIYLLLLLFDSIL